MYSCKIALYKDSDIATLRSETTFQLGQLNGFRICFTVSDTALPSCTHSLHGYLYSALPATLWGRAFPFPYFGAKNGLPRPVALYNDKKAALPASLNWCYLPPNTTSTTCLVSHFFSHLSVRSSQGNSSVPIHLPNSTPFISAPNDRRKFRHTLFLSRARCRTPPLL